MPEIRKIRKNTLEEKVHQLVIFVSVCNLNLTFHPTNSSHLIYPGKPQPPRIGRHSLKAGSNEFFSLSVPGWCGNDDRPDLLQFGHRWQHHSMRQRFTDGLQESLCVLLCFPVALSCSHQTALQIFRRKGFPIDFHHDCHDGRLCGSIRVDSKVK